MSPLNIGILLHYYTTPGDYRHHVDLCHGNSPAVRESLQWFVDQGLLACRHGGVMWAATSDASSRGDRENQCFLITEKGEAMVNHLCAVQVPVCQWVQPPLGG